MFKKYFRRQRSRRSHDDDNKSLESVDVPDSVKRNSLRSTSSFCDEVFFEEESNLWDAEGCNASITTISGSTDEDIFKYQSRLSMSVPAIVSDQQCLGYFVQYLDAKNALPLIKFYLDTENFRAAALAQLSKEQLQQEHEKHVSARKEAVAASPHSVIEEKNHVPELKTLCDLSMRKPLTDDEKSRIYAETNKQIIKCNTNKLKASSEQSLSDAESLNTSICAPSSINDAITIYKKYLIAHAPQFVMLPVVILSQISLLLCQRQEDYPQKFSADCFDDAQNYVLQQLADEFLHDFLQSTFYCKYCIELIEDTTHTSSRLNIFDILYSEVTLFFFMEFLEQQQERDCLDFWTAAINFRKSYFNNEANTDFKACDSKNEAQVDAMIIYEKYFSLQSECRLWMSDRLRCKVEESICAVGNVGSCFDLPLVVTARYLEQKYLTSFMRSQLFENYLNELKLKVHEELNISYVTKDTPPSAGKSSISRHRKTMSDCTNGSTRTLQKNISQQNTLLAMESHNHQPQAAANLSIDPRQLSNPTMLWHRSNSIDGLKFGQVDFLGRFERDFDAVDEMPHAQKSHSWSLTMGGNRIKNAMRKLVNLPEDKVQEEIAWQVAEMIVKDVTAVTLCNGK